MLLLLWGKGLETTAVGGGVTCHASADGALAATVGCCWHSIAIR